MEHTKDLQTILARSKAIREQYHQLEETHHGSRWNIEEDALAFLTDAGLVGRLVMDKEGRWPKPDSNGQLEHKLAESMWWIIVMAELEKRAISRPSAGEWICCKEEIDLE